MPSLDSDLSSPWPGARPGPQAHAGQGAIDAALQRLDLGDGAQIAEVVDRWRSLERRADTSAFIGSTWIRSWLQTLPLRTPVHLLQARQGDTVVGMALLVPRLRLRGGIPVCRTWHLHATGDPRLDTLAIEYNDFLLDRQVAERARATMLAHWLDSTRGPRELNLPGISPAFNGAAKRQALVFGHEALPCRTYAVDLEAVRSHPGAYLGLVSGNLRGQIRRSAKVLEARGPLTLSIAKDEAEALAWLDRLAALHQSRWTAKGLPGAFGNPAFQAFHRRLIAAGVGNGSTQLLALRAGTHEVGYLYNLVHDGHVCVYQSGFDFEVGGKSVKPGYLAHAMAIQLCADQGHRIYDFMVGDARYKASMATFQGELTWSVLRSRHAPLRIEGWLRQLYRRRAWRPATEGGATPEEAA